MPKLITNTGKEFDVSWAAPSSISEGINFYAMILNSDPDEVHKVFKDPEETSVLTLTRDGTVVSVFKDYTRYAGFSVESPTEIAVTLKKQVSW